MTEAKEELVGYRNEKEYTETEMREYDIKRLIERTTSEFMLNDDEVNMCKSFMEYDLPVRVLEVLYKDLFKSGCLFRFTCADCEKWDGHEFTYGFSYPVDSNKYLFQACKFCGTVERKKEVKLHVWKTVHKGDPDCPFCPDHHRWTKIDDQWVEHRLCTRCAEVQVLEDLDTPVPVWERVKKIRSEV